MWDLITLEQWFIIVIGGIVFGSSAACARHFVFGVIPHSAYIALMRYIVVIIVGFYISFIFSQGFLWLLESGDASRLFEVSVAYWTFMGVTLSMSALSRIWRNR